MSITIVVVDRNSMIAAIEDYHANSYNYTLPLRPAITIISAIAIDTATTATFTANYCHYCCYCSQC